MQKPKKKENRIQTKSKEISTTMYQSITLELQLWLIIKAEVGTSKIIAGTGQTIFNQESCSNSGNQTERTF